MKAWILVSTLERYGHDLKAEIKDCPDIRFSEKAVVEDARHSREFRDKHGMDDEGYRQWIIPVDIDLKAAKEIK